ncbi:hypothetical protein [Carbonactinospora thermoautotrophica]|uniref:hypothetical protein n=1 Tax=Carbonactinospora thermoautotrophica TaxID=1469144 RepID=UPI003DA9FBAE
MRGGGARAWLVAREAMVPLNFGAPQAALKMATQARALAGATPSAALALACAVESRARALLGQKSEAKAALRRAETVFTQLPDSARVDNWYGYPERKHFVHASHALTLVGATREAYSAQDNALRLASPTTRMSTALIRIDRASCMVKTGHLTEGFQSAGQVLLGLPQEFRTPLVLSRARGLVNAVPERDRNHRAVREYRDILALGTQLA